MTFTMTKKLKRGRNDRSADANIGDDDFILVDLDAVLDQEEPPPVPLNHVLDDDEAIDRLLINSGFEADDELKEGEREPDALLIDEIDLADDLSDFDRFVIEPVEPSEKDKLTETEESTVPEFYPRSGFDEIVSEEDAIDRLLVDAGFDTRNKPEDADREPDVLLIDEIDPVDDFRDLDQSVIESAGQREIDQIIEVGVAPVQDIYSGAGDNKRLAEDANDELQEDAGASNELLIDEISRANELALDKGSIGASLDKVENHESVNRGPLASGATYQDEPLCRLNKEAGAAESGPFITGHEAFNKQLSGYQEKVEKAARITYVSLGFAIVALLSTVVMGVKVSSLQAKVSKLTDLVSIIEEDLSGAAEKNSAMEMNDSDPDAEQSNQKINGHAEHFAETGNPPDTASEPGTRKEQLPSLLERSTSTSENISVTQAAMNNSFDTQVGKASVLDKKKPSEKALKISSVNKITNSAKAASVWAVNLTAYKELSEAKRKAAKLIQKGIPVEIKAVKMNNIKWYRLKVNGFKNKESADSYAAKIKKAQNLVSVSVSNN
jgi:cell division protein FtsN